MEQSPALTELWETALPVAENFEPMRWVDRPEPVRRYLEHAIAPGTPLATAVRLKMHGQIKLKNWCRFNAEQVIRWDRGMIWRAVVKMYGLPISGFDRLLDGTGAMQWKAIGIIPIMSAAGPDIDRSAAGRLAAEFIWLPSAFCREEVRWSAAASDRIRAEFHVGDQTVQLEFGLDISGRVRYNRLQRWGNPEGGAHHYAEFGALVEEEGRFGGYTIPTRLRVGWHLGSPRFETEGEFFRCVIDQVEYR